MRKLWSNRGPTLLALAFLCLVAALSEHLAATFRGSLGPVPNADWLWDDEHVPGEPKVFWLARDLELSDPLAGTLRIAADEGYRVWWNGRPLGSGRWVEGERAVDEYSLGPVLQSGPNRVLIEARSDRGAGGLLARIEIDGEVRSRDSDWSLFRRYRDGLREGWTDLEGGDAALVIGKVPTGRWRLAPPPRRRPTQLDDPLGSRCLLPVRTRHPAARSDGWIDIETPAVGVGRIPAAPRSPELLFDWGETVEGVLRLELAASLEIPGLAYFGLDLPDPKQALPIVLSALPGDGGWQDLLRRRFRYLLVVGTELAEVPCLTDVPTSLQGVIDRSEVGVFSLRPPDRRLPIEERVWNATAIGPRKAAGAGR